MVEYADELFMTTTSQTGTRFVCFRQAEHLDRPAGIKRSVPSRSFPVCHVKNLMTRSGDLANSPAHCLTSACFVNSMKGGIAINVTMNM